MLCKDISVKPGPNDNQGMYFPTYHMGDALLGGEGGRVGQFGGWCVGEEQFIQGQTNYE